MWDEIGLAHRETFTDARHLIIYGQRTADDRIVFGGRGAPYHFGSRIKPEYDNHARVHRSLHRELVGLFPVLADTPITHRWGGNLGIARDWHASVGLDAATGLGWAGGYVGDGVTTTNLAGRTLRDLILGESTELTVAAVGWARVAQVGGRARPVARGQRRAVRDDARGHRGEDHPAREPAGARHGAVHGRALSRWRPRVQDITVSTGESGSRPVTFLTWIGF